MILCGACVENNASKRRHGEERDELDGREDDPLLPDVQAIKTQAVLGGPSLEHLVAPSLAFVARSGAALSPA